MVIVGMSSCCRNYLVTPSLLSWQKWMIWFEEENKQLSLSALFFFLVLLALCRYVHTSRSLCYIAIRECWVLLSVNGMAQWAHKNYFFSSEKTIPVFSLDGNCHSLTLEVRASILGLMVTSVRNKGGSCFCTLAILGHLMQVSNRHCLDYVASGIA